jgi:hypothetical protein
MKGKPPGSRLAQFMARHSPGVRSVARASLARMRSILPGWTELVYDNYNALAIGFSPTDRTSYAVFSLALYPRWVSLFFLTGADLRGPRRLLRGNGRRVRHTVLTSAEDLDSAGIRELIAQAVRSAAPPSAVGPRHRTVIKSVSAKRRPRRPGPARSPLTKTERARTT